MTSRKVGPFLLGIMGTTKKNDFDARTVRDSKKLGDEMANCDVLSEY